jgi:NADPH2:quinone reductase
MKSWRAERFGSTSEVLRLCEVALPKPAPGQIALKVRAAAVALPDLLMLQGKYPPLPNPPIAPGMEVAGEVMMVGEGAKYGLGDHVMAIAASMKGWGSLAEYCLADAANSMPIPASMSDAEAAGFMVAFKTAYVALAIRTPIQAGDTLLVLGAAGSTGAATVLLGKALGAQVIAVASSAEKLAFCREIGADQVLNNRDGDITERVKELTGGRGVDIVFDPVGGELAKQAMGCMARHGRFGVVGYASGEWAPVSVLAAVLKNYSLAGVFAGNLSNQETEQTFSELLRLAEAGQIHTPVRRVFSFTQVPEALNLLETRKQGGRIVIDMNLRR